VKKYCKLLILILLNTAVLQSCSIFRKTQTVTVSGEKSTLWIKKTGLYSCNNGQKLGKLDIRYIEDSVMVIIIRNNTGIEGGRLYIFRDSMFLFNRISKKYMVTKLTGNGENRLASDNELRKLGTILLQKEYTITNREIILKEIKGIARIEILKFNKQSRKKFVPEKFKVNIQIERQRYCIYGTAENIVTDQYVPVALIKYQGKYKKVRRIHDIV